MLSLLCHLFLVLSLLFMWDRLVVFHFSKPLNSDLVNGNKHIRLTAFLGLLCGHNEIMYKTRRKKVPAFTLRFQDSLTQFSQGQENGSWYDLRVINQLLKLHANTS